MAQYFYYNSNCGGQNGYNYTVNMNYSVTFSVTGASSAQLYALNAYLTCSNTSYSNDPSYFPLLPLPANCSGSKASSTSFAQKQDCATATPSSLGCNSMVIKIQGSGIVGNDGNTNSIKTLTCSSGPILPVTFFGFLATPILGKVTIRWFTATETNNEYFTVQKSRDRLVYSDLERINGKGTTNIISVYNTIDNAPFIGTTYYRIKQTDVDGTVSYSLVETATTTTTMAESRISVFPNPNTTQWVSFIGNTSNQKLDVFSISGSKVFSIVLQGSTLILPISVKGVYIFNFTDQLDGSKTISKYIQK